MGKNKPIIIKADCIKKEEYGETPCRIIVDGSATQGLFSIVEQNLKKGKISDNHLHTLEGHSVDILSGFVLVSLEGHLYELKAGDFIYIPPYVWHEFKVLEDETRIRITNYPAGFENIFEELQTNPVNKHSKISAKYGILVTDNSVFKK